MCPNCLGAWNQFWEVWAAKFISARIQVEKKATLQKSALFIAFMLLMKICVVHPAGLCTECWSPEGSGRALGAMDSDLWLARPWEGGGAWESVPSRAFLATPQSTIPFFYTCWAELLFSLFYIQQPAKGKVQLTSKAVNVHQNTHWDLSVTWAPAFFNYFFFFHSSSKNEQQSQPACIALFCMQRGSSFISADNSLRLFSCVQVNCLRKSGTLGWQLATRAVRPSHAGLSPAALGYLQASVGQRV